MKCRLTQDLKDVVVNAMQILIVAAAAFLASLYERLEGGSCALDESC